MTGKKKSPEIQNLLKLRIIFLIESAPICGYTLMKQLEIATGKKISPSQVYPFLSSLRKQGYVSAETSSGGRDKKRYSLTPEGREFLSQLVPKLGSIVDFAVKHRVKKCEHCRVEIYSGEFRKGHKFFCCPHCAKAHLSEKKENCRCSVAAP
ncbi:MAG: PadR family transcriptional regulator [archaeon]